LRAGSIKQTEIEELAKRTDLSKEEMQRLYDSVEAQFPSTTPTPVTKSMLDSWMPQMTDENANRILLWRNMKAANKMVARMEQGSRKRQQKILESIREGDANE